MIKPKIQATPSNTKPPQAQAAAVNPPPSGSSGALFVGLGLAAAAAAVFFLGADIEVLLGQLFGSAQTGTDALNQPSAKAPPSAPSS